MLGVPRFDPVRLFFLLSLGSLALALGCERDVAVPAGSSASAAPAPSASLRSPAETKPPAAGVDALPPIPIAEFARLFRELSEPDRYFFSDNYVSNETSYLQVAPLLDRRARKGGAYIGVGPEQNFTYVSLLEPEIAFIVDIRRQNALQHLLFKAIFHQAKGRASFLALLLGREPRSEVENASVAELLVHVEKTTKPERAAFDRIHARLVTEITGVWKIPLSAKDQETLAATHRAFFEGQLDLAFELHEANGRKYPKLRELLAADDPSGRARGFLATEPAFRSVQKLQQKNRVVPVVGDFAGEHALKAVAAELRRRDLPVNAFYVSNVEQYVMEPDKWRRYFANVDALPSDERSVFIRCYLDQGRAHPLQMKGHRTATVLQPFDHFEWRQKKRGYGSFWSLATDGNVGAPDGGAP